MNTTPFTLALLTSSLGAAVQHGGAACRCRAADPGNYTGLATPASSSVDRDGVDDSGHSARQMTFSMLAAYALHGFAVPGETCCSGFYVATLMVPRP